MITHPESFIVETADMSDSTKGNTVRSDLI